jgi:hypothetical protein
VKNKINHGHYIELMDRLHVQTCMIEDHLVSHPLTKKIKKAKKLIDDAVISLAEAYQIVGNKSYKNKQRNEKNIFGRRKDSCR